jgi:2-desacetyl-2-hydroxyethyl bacteriochlorophyllide A dehydrogenase
MSTIDARAFWIVEPGRGEIRDETLAAVGDADVVVHAMFSGISRGTEALVFRGRVPVSEYERMRAPFQSGDFPAPIKYGYASVGRVEQGPAELAGRTVFVLFPHQSRYVVPARAVYVLPRGVPPSRAVLAANLETAVNGLWDARPHIGDRIAVIGAGAVGCLVAWLAARIGGCEVQLIDVNPQRVAVAAKLGVSFAVPEDAIENADVVVHASGSAAGLDLAWRLAAFETHVVEMSWYGADAVSIALGHAFHSKRLSLISSQVGTVATSQRTRWNHRRRMEFALSMLTEAALDTLITGESDFETLPETLAQLSEAPGDTICHRIRY